ncbi:MAG: chemotaxis protein CheA [Rhodospirillaceae bacterium]
MDEFLEQFLIESRELVVSANDDLRTLEDSPADKEALDNAFRAFHTLKGGAGIVDFHVMGKALHAAEDALSSIRAGARALTPPMIGDFLTCLDQVSRWLDVIESTGEIPAGADMQANAIVEIFTDAVAAAMPAPAPAAAPSALLKTVIAEQHLLVTDPAAHGRAGRWTSAANVAANALHRAGRRAEAQAIEKALAPALESGAGDGLADTIAAVLRGFDDLSTAAPALDSAPRTIRVDAVRLDDLVNLAGELAVAKNTAGHIARLAQDSGNPLTKQMHDHQLAMDKLVASLQRSVLAMRVLPVRQLFQRFRRLVRDMTKLTGRPARLVTSGEDTEADKGVIDALYEPLLHLLRNALDHGIETAEIRRSAGKPETATIELRAARAADMVIVEVADDGAGVDVAKVRDVAQARGLGTAEQIGALSDAEVTDLIFQPGFSTASAITEHSGRGVGMDAVRTALARMGGRVAMETVPGRGSTVRLTMPFSVVMTQVMTVEAGGQRFGIPLESVVETFRVARHVIQSVGTAAAVVHRDRTLPVVNLARLLDGKTDDLPVFGNKDEAILVKVAFGGMEGTFEVERLGDRMDIMLKPLVGLLKGTPGITGTTLLGDGSVLIVLDVEALLS